MWEAFKAKMGTLGKGKGKPSQGRGKVRGGKSNRAGIRAIVGLQESQEEDWLNGGEAQAEGVEEQHEDAKEEGQEEEDLESGNT